MGREDRGLFLLLDELDRTDLVGGDEAEGTVRADDLQPAVLRLDLEGVRIELLGLEIPLRITPNDADDFQLILPQVERDRRLTVPNIVDPLCQEIEISPCPYEPGGFQSPLHPAREGVQAPFR